MAPKLPFRLKQVVYTLSPYEQSVTGNFWKNAPGKLQKKFAEVRELKMLIEDLNRCGRTSTCSMIRIFDASSEGKQSFMSQPSITENTHRPCTELVCCWPVWSCTFGWYYNVSAHHVWLVAA